MANRVEQARREVFEAFDKIIRQGYRGMVRPSDHAHLPTPMSALDKLIDAARSEAVLTNRTSPLTVSASSGADAVVTMAASPGQREGET